MKLISYYCDIDGKTFYSDHAKRLKARCDELGIPHDIRELSIGRTLENHWIAGEKLKGQFIKDMFHELKEPLLWLDVDCDILKKPDFVWSSEWGFDWREDNVPCDYVHYIDYNERNAAFIDKWVQEIKSNGLCTHSAMIKLYKQLNWFIVPKGYFKLVLAEGIPSRHKYLSMMDSMNKKRNK